MAVVSPSRRRRSLELPSRLTAGVERGGVRVVFDGSLVVVLCGVASDCVLARYHAGRPVFNCQCFGAPQNGVLSTVSHLPSQNLQARKWPPSISCGGRGSSDLILACLALRVRQNDLFLAATGGLPRFTVFAWSPFQDAPSSLMMGRRLLGMAIDDRQVADDESAAS